MTSPPPPATPPLPTRLWDADRAFRQMTDEEIEACLEAEAFRAKTGGNGL